MSSTAGIKLVCTHPGCGKRTVARRLCSAHYQAAWRAGDLDKHAPSKPREKKHGHVCPPAHKHAQSTTCYIQHQCRCDECVEDHNARESRRRRLKAYGRFDTGLVDAEPVREHVLDLIEYGIGYKRIADLAGVGVTGVRTLVWGRQDPGPRYGEIPKRVGREKAEKILAVQPEIENMGSGRPVSAIGTHRRIQALVARGWSVSRINALLGWDPGSLHSKMRRDKVSVATHLAVADIYEQIWNQQPPRQEWRERIAYSRSVRFAQRQGWLPPLAWDDIDTDPEPPRDTVRQGRATADEVLDDVEFLLDAGESPEQVAAIVGRKLGALTKLAERNGRRELANVFNAIEKRAA